MLVCFIYYHFYIPHSIKPSNNVKTLSLQQTKSNMQEQTPLEAAAEKKIYENFLRQKSTIYVHKLPQLTVNELYNKISKEWNNLSLHEKKQLGILNQEPSFLSKGRNGSEDKKTNKSSDSVKVRSTINTIAENVHAKIKVSQEKSIKLDKQKMKKDKKKSKSKSMKKTKPKRQKSSKKLKEQIPIIAELPNRVQQQDYPLEDSYNSSSNNPQPPTPPENQTYNIKQQYQLNQLPSSLFFNPDINQSSSYEHEQIISEQSFEPAALKIETVDEERFRLESELENQSKQLRFAIQSSSESESDEEQVSEKDISQSSIQPENKNEKNEIKNLGQKCIKKQKKNNNTSSDSQFVISIPKKTTKYLEYYKAGFKAMKITDPHLSSIEITKVLTAIWKQQKKMKLKQKSSSINLEPKFNLDAERLILARKHFNQQKIIQGKCQPTITSLWWHLPKECKLLWADQSYTELNRSNQPSHPISTIRYGHSSIPTKQYFLDLDIFDEIPPKKYQLSLNETMNLV